MASSADADGLKETKKSLDTTPTPLTTSRNNSADEKIAEAANGPDEKKAAPQDAAVADDETRYLTGWKLAVVFFSFMLTVLLICLDQTIVATAQPVIVSKFNALDKIAWVTSAYFLTNAGLILPVGQIMTFSSTKTVYLTAVIVFEIGSLLCGVAPNIDFLIFGRAIAGCGAAGIFVSILSILAEVTRLEDRPMLFGCFGAVSAVASAVGPLLGGVFTDHVSWRWCFYINLPFGAVAILFIIVFLKTKSGPKKSIYQGMTLTQRWLALDYLGLFLCLALVTCLLLALQWGGNTKPWNDGSVIATLVLFGVLLIAFIAWEWYIGERAMLPIDMLKRRTQTGCALEGFFIFIGMILAMYYLPLWYQARGSSASRSGIDILGYMLSVVIAAGISGGIITATGRYWHILVISPMIAAVGYGLLYTIRPDMKAATVIGFQIIAGVGIGGALQNVIIATQAEWAHEEEMIPQATAIISFIQIVGGLVGVTVGASIFGNELVKNLGKFAPSLDALAANAVRFSVTAIFELPKELQTGVIEAYSASLNTVFIIGVAAAAMASASGLIIKNYNIKERSPTGGLAVGGA